VTVSTLRPNAETANISVVATGGTTSAVLADNTDATYDTFDAANDQLTVALTDLTLPAGAIIKQVALRARVALTSAGNYVFLVGVKPAGGDLYAWNQSVSWTTPTTISWIVLATRPDTGLPWADADVDGGEMHLQCDGTTPPAAIRVYEAYLDATYVTQPTVTVTAPTGTLTTTNTPAVTWTRTLDGDGGAQTRFEVKIFNDDQYLAGGFDPATSASFDTSGITTSAATTWTPTTPQPNDTYRAYVRIAQTVNGALHWSNWSFSGYVINTPSPAAPSFAVTPDNTLARNQIVLTANSGAATTDYFQLERTLDGAVTWIPVRLAVTTGLITPSAGTATVYDYEASNGTASYRARALHNYSGLYAASEWTYLSTVTNLVPNPSAEIDTTGWALAQSGTWTTPQLSRSVIWASSGVASFRVTGIKAADAVSQRIGMATPAGTAGMPVSASTTYTVQAVVNVQNAPVQGMRFALEYYDAAGTLIDSDASGLQYPNQIVIATMSVTFTTPALTAFLAIRVEGLSNVASDTVVFNVDSIMVEAGATASAYGDGDTLGWEWTGTPHNSRSVKLTNNSWTSTSWWLKDPRTPTDNQTIVVRSLPEIQFPARQGVIQPFGATYPVVIEDTRSPGEGVLTVRCDTDTTYNQLAKLAAHKATLLLQAPPSHNFPDQYIRLGDITRQRAIDMAPAPSQYAACTFVVVASPTGTTT